MNRVRRETKEAPFRPKTRRLVNLTNTELSQLFQLRAEAVRAELHGHKFWNNDFIVYWHTFMDRQDALYEVMMEIQARYPESEIKPYSDVLPVKEPREVER